jgi:hypothetical protein
MFLFHWFLSPRWWRRYFTPKRRFWQKPHGVSFQKKTFLEHFKFQKLYFAKSDWSLYPSLFLLPDTVPVSTDACLYCLQFYFRHHTRRHTLQSWIRISGNPTDSERPRHEYMLRGTDSVSCSVCRNSPVLFTFYRQWGGGTHSSFDEIPLPDTILSFWVPGGF